MTNNEDVDDDQIKNIINHGIVAYHNDFCASLDIEKIADHMVKNNIKEFPLDIFEVPNMVDETLKFIRFIGNKLIEDDNKSDGKLSINEKYALMDAFIDSIENLINSLKLKK